VNEASKALEALQDATGDPFDAASFWHGVFEDHEPAPEERARFEAWLIEDPLNRRAYESVQCTWASMATTGVDERILRMRREALAAPQQQRDRWFMRAGIAASVLGTGLLIGVVVHYNPMGDYGRGGDFATQVGQRTSITLADGSNVVLNTASRIHVNFDGKVRLVRLLSGQAWFEVAKNQPRPFVVEAGDRIVTAHGTAFDVRLEDHDRVQITLIEGRVSVEAVSAEGGGPNLPVEHEDLMPGDQLTVAPTKPAAKRKADMAKATSWREGQIIFDDDTLANAVAEINRYSAKKIVLADERLGSLRMSGVFIAGHNESFLETITANFPIKVMSDSGGQLVLTVSN